MPSVIRGSDGFDSGDWGVFESAPVPCAVSQSFTLAHGLGRVPAFVSVDFVCTTDAAPFVVGDIISNNVDLATAGGNGFGAMVTKDATNIYVQEGQQVNIMYLTTSGTVGYVPRTSFSIVVRAL